MTHVEKELAKTVQKISRIMEQMQLLQKLETFLLEEVGKGSQIDIEDEIEEAEKGKGDEVPRSRPSRKKG